MCLFFLRVLLLRICFGNSTIYNIINFCPKLLCYGINIPVSGDPSFRILAVSKKNGQRGNGIHCKEAQKNQYDNSAYKTWEHAIQGHAKPISDFDHKYTKNTPDTGGRHTDIAVQIPLDLAVIPPSFVIPHLN